MTEAESEYLIRELYAALQNAAELIRDRFGDPKEETGWSDPDMMDAWIGIWKLLHRARVENEHNATASVLE